MSEKEKHEYAFYKTMTIAVIIEAIWRMLEMIIHGEPTPSIEDTIIGLIFMLYIYNSELIKIRAKRGNRASGEKEVLYRRSNISENQKP